MRRADIITRIPCQLKLFVNIRIEGEKKGGEKRKKKSESGRVTEAAKKKKGDVGDDRLESRRIGATSEPSAALLHLQTKSLLTSSFSLLYLVIY